MALTPGGGTQTIPAPAAQSFNVVAPRFTIDPKDVHSVYPSQGHADQPSILPHIVFTDPHVPWERALAGDVFTEDDRMPWTAVIPFDINGPDAEQELRLSDAEFTALTAPLTTANSPPVK